MQFNLNKPFRESLASSMRKIGYYFKGSNEEKEEMIFVRPLSKNDYPRFHIYLKIDPKSLIPSFSLHLDQKKPSYEGTAAHSGEYEGETIEKESKRIKQLLQ